MKDKIQALMVKLKLDKHHRIERFGVLFFSLVLVMAILVSISMVQHIKNQRIVLTDKAIYTTEDNWSLTGQSVQVVNMYRNKNCTKSFILLKTNVDKLSVDAHDYQVLMTGYQGEVLKNKNAIGAVYIFGNTGYMGLYFADASGFDKQLYNITLRNFRLITGDRVENGDYADSSDSKKNQIHILANLAGKDAIVAKFLEEDNPELIDIYAETVSVTEEESVRTELNDTLISMNNQMSLINEEAKFLTRMNIVIPSLPTAIAGDYITDNVDETANNPKQFSEDMYDDIDSKISSTYENIKLDTSVSDETGESVWVDSDKLYLVTDFVFPGGYQYNYQDMRITDHYVTNNILPEGMKFKAFAAEKSNEMNHYSYYSDELNNKYSKWYYTTETGEVERWTPYEYSEEDKAIQKSIDSYTAGVRELYRLKEKFQTEYLADLARIEYSAETTASLFSINTDDDVLLIYE